MNLLKSQCKRCGTGAHLISELKRNKGDLQVMRRIQAYEFTITVVESSLVELLQDKYLLYVPDSQHYYSAHMVTR